MNENFDEKNSGKEQILSDEVLAEVTGGTDGNEGLLFNASYVCPLCGKSHRFSFTLGWAGSKVGYVFVDQGDHCRKIERLYKIESANATTKTGIVEMETTEGDWVKAVFFIVGM